VKKNPTFSTVSTPWQNGLESSESRERSNEDLFQEWRGPSVAGNELVVMEWVTSIVHPLYLSGKRLARLQLAVVEATRNAIEHGNQFRPDRLLLLQVQVSPTAIMVRIRDQGTQGHLADPPSLAIKLAEPQTGRGWGLYLIKHLVDGWHVRNEAQGHTIELLMSRMSTEEEGDHE